MFTKRMSRLVQLIAVTAVFFVPAISRASTIIVDTTAKTLTFTGAPESGTASDIFGNGFIQWDLGAVGINSATVNFAGASSFNSTPSSTASSAIILDFNASDTTLSRISIAQAYLAATGPGTLQFNPVVFSYAGLNATQQATFEATVLGGPFSVPLEPGSSGFNPVFFSAAIPEPGTFALASVVAIGCLGWRLRRRKVKQETDS